MNRSYWKNLLLLLPVLFLWTACGGDAPKEEKPEPPPVEEVEEEPAITIDSEQLNGTWTVLAASRNGKKTESLDGAYFMFEEDGRMETNIMGDPEENTYSSEGNMITQSGPSGLKFKVQRLEDSLMVLSTDIQNYFFQFQLKRDEAETAE